MKVGVIGTGYVGLVAGGCFAESGNEVICVDNDEPKIRGLQNGRVPIYEPGLPEIIQRNLRERRLIFSTKIEEAVKKSSVLFITVGTPSAADGSANSESVFQVGREIAKAMEQYKIVITKSTVPLGTTEKLRDVIRSLVTEWQAFRNPDFERVRSLMRRPVVFDGRNLYDPRRLQSLGFHYFGVGRARPDFCSSADRT